MHSTLPTLVHYGYEVRPLATLTAHDLLKHALQRDSCDLDINPQDEEAIAQALRDMQHIELDPAVLVMLTGVYTVPGLHPDAVYHACHLDCRGGCWTLGVTEDGHRHQEFLPANFRLV